MDWELELEAKGRVIRQLREERHLTQADIEEKTGIGVSHLSQVENGLKVLHDKKLTLLLQVFEIKKSEFMAKVEENAASIYAEAEKKRLLLAV